MIRSLSGNTERFCDSGNHNPVGASPNNRPAIHGRAAVSARLGTGDYKIPTLARDS